MFPLFLVAVLVLRLTLGFAAALTWCYPDSGRDVQKDQEATTERKGQKEE